MHTHTTASCTRTTHLSTAAGIFLLGKTLHFIPYTSKSYIIYLRKCNMVLVHGLILEADEDVV